MGARLGIRGMTKQQTAICEAEAFVRRAVTQFAEKPSEEAIKRAARKVVRVLRRQGVSRRAGGAD